MNIRTIGRVANCDLVLTNTGASRRHATLELLEDGAIWLMDEGSSNGTFLQRNDGWIRIRKVSLCVGDRIRFADDEMPLQQLTEVFGNGTQIRLGEKRFSLRQGSTMTAVWDQEGPRLQKPKRNLLTGKIEEDRK